ncbi:MAG: MFS transporter [Deltaproteobacteria bacterium]|nr:MFS transporter [Deltaproteobacteria bacterium]
MKKESNHNQLTFKKDSKEALFTKEFLVLNGIIFLVYCNIAIFFQFYQYLKSLSIEPEWIGFLIGLFSLTALVIRPFVSPILNPENAIKWIYISLIAVIISLLLYYPAKGQLSMAFVRIMHGAAYVIMATAVIAKVVGVIPPKRSGEAFGMISVITLLPYAVIPPILPPLIKKFDGFIPVLYLTALILVFVFPLLFLLKGKKSKQSAIPSDRIHLNDLIEDLSDKRILLLLIISLLLFTAFTPIFYFIKSYGESVGITNPGWFFTISTFTEIAVRVFGGRMFDKFNKSVLLFISLFGLMVGYILLANIKGILLFYWLGFFFGLSWGGALPVLNSLIFDISLPRFRALNTNLGLEMFQGGFFLGPFIGGFFIANWNYSVLYYFCATLIVVGMAFTFMVTKIDRRS